jgi:hypothetical protein
MIFLTSTVRKEGEIRDDNSIETFPIQRIRYKYVHSLNKSNSYLEVWDSEKDLKKVYLNFN